MSLILIGLIVGFILGLFGAGGTILAVPFLIFGLNMDPKMAIPISMFAVAVSAIFGSIDGLIKQQIRYRASMLIAFFAMLISPFAIWLAQFLPKQPLMILFAGLLLFVGLHSFMKRSKNEDSSNANDSEELFPCEINQQTHKIRWTNQCARALSLTGGMTGLMSGLLGVGGGFIIVPALQRFSNIKLDNIFPTSLAVIAIVSSYNSLIFLSTGMLNIHYGLLFCMGTTAGMFFSKRLKINNKGMDKGFASFLILMAVLLVIKAVLF